MITPNFSPIQSLARRIPYNESRRALFRDTAKGTAIGALVAAAASPVLAQSPSAPDIEEMGLRELIQFSETTSLGRLSAFTEDFGRQTEPIVSIVRDYAQQQDSVLKLDGKRKEMITGTESAIMNGLFIEMARRLRSQPTVIDYSHTHGFLNPSDAVIIHYILPRVLAAFGLLVLMDTQGKRDAKGAVDPSSTWAFISVYQIIQTEAISIPPPPWYHPFTTTAYGIKPYTRGDGERVIPEISEVKFNAIALHDSIFLNDGSLDSQMQGFQRDRMDFQRVIDRLRRRMGLSSHTSISHMIPSVLEGIKHGTVSAEEVEIFARASLFESAFPNGQKITLTDMKSTGFAHEIGHLADNKDPAYQPYELIDRYGAQTEREIAERNGYLSQARRTPNPPFGLFAVAQVAASVGGASGTIEAASIEVCKGIIDSLVQHMANNPELYGTTIDNQGGSRELQAKTQLSLVFDRPLAYHYCLAAMYYQNRSLYNKGQKIPNPPAGLIQDPPPPSPWRNVVTSLVVTALGISVLHEPIHIAIVKRQLAQGLKNLGFESCDKMWEKLADRNPKSSWPRKELNAVIALLDPKKYKHDPVTAVRAREWLELYSEYTHHEQMKTTIGKAFEKLKKKGKSKPESSENS